MGFAFPRASPGMRHRVGTVVLATLFCSAVATPGDALTLREAMAQAARTNPAMTSARAAARVRHEGVPKAFAAWLPSVTLTVDGTHARTFPHDTASTATVLELPGLDPFPITTTGRRDSREERLVTEINTSLNLFRSGGDTAALRRAEEIVRHGHVSVEDTEQTVFLNVATAYLDVVLAERVMALRTSALAAFEERVREAEARFRVRDATLADLSQALAERDVADADVLSARANLEIQRALFEFQVGVPPLGLEEAGEPADLPATLEAARRSAREDRPGVRMAGHAVRVAEQALRAAQAGFGPRVDLIGRARRTTTDPALLFEQDDVTVGVRFAMPLYRGGGAPVREARKEVARLRADLDAARIEALQLATNAWHRLDSARHRLVAFEAAAEASRVALDGVRRGADIGERTTREVLDAQRRLLERQIQILSAERDVVVEAYRLLEATGGLTARRLGIEGLPDLEREAREVRAKLAPGVLDLFEEE